MSFPGKNHTSPSDLEPLDEIDLDDVLLLSDTSHPRRKIHAITVRQLRDFLRASD